jgi:bifunctional UDP-N-acetylglucosamine pyrophosphorylase/glucosamine-1-phosphate N-acetyltransferase
MSDLHIVVLAAGKGTRMKSAMPKVLHRVAGRPMIEHVLAAAANLQPRSMTVVIGHEADSVRATLSGSAPAQVRAGLTFVVQEPQLGTGHALLSAAPVLASATGTVLLLSGDVPLLSAQSLRALVDRHRATGAAATVVTAVVDQPRGYGRIVRSGREIARIVEDRDASPAEREIREINSGIYALELEDLFESIRSIGTDNAQHEYYLPDLVGLYRRRGRVVDTLTLDNADELRGINSRQELAEVSCIVRQQKNAELMAAGVTIEDPATTYIDQSVVVGPDTVIHPGVSLEGTTTVGAGCEIHSGVRIVNSQLGSRVTVFNHSVISDATIGDEARVGPFAHLRQEADVREGARVGNFVELKKTVIGRGSKAMHLTYLGDATIGSGVNIGAGTITCNFDGTTKQRTIIEDGAFVGSDSQLIAPVTIHAGAYIGSGTTVREDVPSGALAVSAGKQRNIERWTDKKKRTRN